MQLTEYPDGSSYVTVPFVDDIFNDWEVQPSEQDYASAYDKIVRINSYEDLWHLNQYVDAVNNLGYRPTITIPCLIDAQADRRFRENSSSGLKLVMEFLNSMDALFKIFHPHNPEVVEAGVEAVEIIDNSMFIKRVLFHCPLKKDGKIITVDHEDYEDNLILMSSDAGGFKPLMKLCDNLDWKGEVYSASKSRKRVEGESKLTQIIDRQDFGGKDVLIVDDLSIYGGTFKGLSKLLRERNVGRLYLAVSHMTVKDLGQDSVTKYFDRVYTTNSKFDEYAYDKTSKNNLHVIKMF